MVSAGFVGGGSRQRHGAAQRELPDEPGQQEADDGDRGGEQKVRVPAGGDRGLEDVLNGVRQRHRGDHHRHEQQALLVADAPWTYCWNCGRNVMPPNMATRPRWWACAGLYEVTFRSTRPPKTRGFADRRSALHGARVRGARWLSRPRDGPWARVVPPLRSRTRGRVRATRSAGRR